MSRSYFTEDQKLVKMNFPKWTWDESEIPFGAKAFLQTVYQELEQMAKTMMHYKSVEKMFLNLLKNYSDKDSLQNSKQKAATMHQ